MSMIVIHHFSGFSPKGPTRPGNHYSLDLTCFQIWLSPTPNSFWPDVSHGAILYPCLGLAHLSAWRALPITVDSTPFSISSPFKILTLGTSMVVPRLRLYAPNAGGSSMIPGQGTRSQMPQLKILHGATEIWGS